MSSQNIPVVLVVDDEELNLRIIQEYLDDVGYESVAVTSGAEGLRLLQEAPQRFSAILLDRMMPEMDGIEVLKIVKNDPLLNMLPVIMQTARAAKEDIREGLQAGANYYLTKPFEEETLLAIVNNAISDYQNYSRIKQEVESAAKTVGLMDKGSFSFRTLDEARNLAVMLASTCPEAGQIGVGLSELMINAIEHGNLAISYEEKTELNRTGEWQQEVKRRLEMSEYKDRLACIEFERQSNRVSFLIKDQGEGFSWQEYLDSREKRAFDSHGRGIAMAKMLSFDALEYRGSGNEVLATLILKQDDQA